MNEEARKAIEEAKRSKVKKTSNIRKWWYKNSYKVFRVIFFWYWYPYQLYCIIAPKVKEKIIDKTPWSDEKAKEVLDYYVPRRAWYAQDIDGKEGLVLSHSGWCWDIKYAKKYLKRKHRNFWKVWAHRGGEVQYFLEKKYELDGFTKKVERCYSDEVYIKFILNDGE